MVFFDARAASMPGSSTGVSTRTADYTDGHS